MKQNVIMYLLVLIAICSCSDNISSEKFDQLLEKIREAQFLIENTEEAPILGEIAPGAKIQLQRDVDWANYIASNSSNEEAYESAIVELDNAITAFENNRVKSGLPFFSKGSYIYTGDVSELIDKTQFSIACKIRLSDLKCDETTNLGNFITSDKNGKSIIFRYTEAGAIHAYIYANGWKGAITEDGVLKINHWYNLVFTFDGMQIAIYQDGKIVGNITFDNRVSAEIEDDAPFHVGAAPETKDRSMHGNIVGVSFWKKALDSNEVNNLIAEEINELTPNLSAFWPFTLNLGSQIQDKTGKVTAIATNIEWINE